MTPIPFYENNTSIYFSLITVCRRRYVVELHEENEIGHLLEKENHSINGLDCSHEEEECTPSIEKHKDKINQGMKAKHKN